MHRREVLRAGLGVATAGALGRAGVFGRAAADQPVFAPLARVDVDGTKEAVVRDDGRIAYLAVTDGYAVVDVADPAEPRVVAERRGILADREDGPLHLIQDLKEDGDRLLVVGPAHGGHDLHAAILVDVSNPADPRRVAVFETDYPIHNCDLADGYAYLTNFDGERNPLVVLDVRGDDPAEVARWSIVDHDGAWADVPPGLRPLHDVSVVGDVACLAHWDAGTWLVDVSDPADPTYLGNVTEYSPDALAELDSRAARRQSRLPPGNDHYATLDETGTLLAVGKESWAVDVDGKVVGGPSGVALYDVSTPAEPVHLSTIAPPSTPEPTRSGLWTTAHNLDLRGGTLYTSWYDGGVTRHDVSDPANPTRESWWRDPDTARFWTAQVAVPGEFFVASDMGEGYDESAAELFTFPDRPGEQADPPDLQWEAAAGTVTAAGATTASGDRATGTETRTTGGETAATGTTGMPPSSGSASTDDSSLLPPLEAVAALAGGLFAVLGGGWWLSRRERP
jgi:hypothetical protein